MGLLNEQKRGSKKVLELFWLSSLLVLAFSFSFVFLYRIPQEHPVFLQTNLLVPAVFFAAGMGMGTADIDDIPGLKPFILKEKEYFDGKNIPADTVVQPLTTELELRHLYYLYAVGWVWRLFGISQNALAFFTMLWYIAGVVAVYAIFLCFFKPFPSFAGAVLFLTLPFHFHPLIGLREQGSVPFMLWILWGIVFVARKCKTRRSYFFVAFMSGAFIGIGQGFRGEIPLYCPPLLVALYFFPNAISGFSVKIRLAALSVFLLSLSLCLIPLRQTMDSAHAHTYFVGIAPDIEQTIPFGEAGYESLPSSDAAVYAMVSAFAKCRGDRESMVNEKSSEYARAQGDKNAPLLWDPSLFFNGEHYREQTFALMRQVIGSTPADLVARAWYSVFYLPGMPYQVLSSLEIKNFPEWLQKIVKFHYIFSLILCKSGMICSLFLLLCCSVISYKQAFFWFAMLAWFFGYPSLQYEFRNYYFLSFVPILILFLATSRIVQCAKLFDLKIKEKHFRVLFKEGVAALKRPLIFTSFILLAVIAPVLALRSWQVHAISSIARELAGASLQEVETVSSLSEGACLVSPKETLPGLVNASSLPAGETAWQYVAVEVDTCGKDIPLTIRYNSRLIMYDFSQTVTLFGIPDGKKGSLLFFFPVYEVDMNYGGTLMPSEILDIYPHVKDIVDSDVPIEEQQWWRRGKFEGIAVPEEYRQHIRKMYIVSPDEGFCWLPIFQLPEDSRYLRCYKTGSLKKTFSRWLKTLKST
jgi:hypothetical protein